MKRTAGAFLNRKGLRGRGESGLGIRNFNPMLNP